MPEFDKFPIILPGKSHIANLIIKHCHKQVNHQGRGLTINEVQSCGFQIVGGSSAVTSRISKCVKCRKLRGVAEKQKKVYVLRNEYIKIPETEAETLAATGTFKDLSELPNIVGAIDGSHIRIKVPKDNAVDYFSRYQQHDFIIQAVVNDQKLFLDFICGFPGSMHDARVLRRSTIFRKAEQGDILSAPTVHINGNELGPYLVGDSAYPLSPWLIKPYPEGTRDRNEIRFNKQLSSARVKVEYAFGLLKGTMSHPAHARDEKNLLESVRQTISIPSLV